jgi:hypothetical protein
MRVWNFKANYLPIIFLQIEPYSPKFSFYPEQNMRLSGTALSELHTNETAIFGDKTYFLISIPEVSVWVCDINQSISQEPVVSHQLISIKLRLMGLQH